MWNVHLHTCLNFIACASLPFHTSIYHQRGRITHHDRFISFIGMKGFYRRPSKAIEQGGGFFIPGLEGERIRIVTALALLVALLG